MPTPNTDQINYFGELLSVLSLEELLRLRRRFQMRHKERMAEILTDEILSREALVEAELRKAAESDAH